MTLLDGDIHRTECANLIETLNIGYQSWHGWNVKMQAPFLKKLVLILVNEIMLAENAIMYI